MAQSLDSRQPGFAERSPGLAEELDTRKLLAEASSVRQDKALVLNRAHEEYCERKRRGEQIDIDEFCQRYAAYSASVRCRLEVEDFLDSNLELLLGLAPQWPKVGDVLQGYRLCEELGRGAIGRVYLAEELALAHRRVVVKLTTDGFDEAETLARLEHPRIVPIHSVAYDEEACLTVICMPLLSRWTLQDFLDVAQPGGKLAARFEDCLDALRQRDGARPAENDPPLAGRRQPYVEGVLALVAQLCDALAHAHAKGVYHLDIKPSNVLLRSDGTPMLLDFNLAATGGQESRMLGGTLPYMSPEQVRSCVFEEQRDEFLGANSDIYSLGILLYQLLTGAPPFRNLDFRQPSKHLAGELLVRQEQGLEAIFGQADGIADSLRRIVRRATAWSPRERYASVADMGADLRAALAVGPRLWRVTQRHRRAFLASALLASGGALASAAGLSMREPYLDRMRKHGWRLFEEGRNQEALDCFTALVEGYPECADAWFGRGRVRLRRGDYFTVARDFARAHELAPEGRQTACIAFSMSALGRPREAAPIYLRAMEEGFETAELCNSLGLTYTRISDHPEAVRWLQRAIELKPTLSTAWHNLAAVYLQMCLVTQQNLQIADACRAIETALAQDPENGGAHWTASVIWWQSREPGWQERALFHASKAVDAGIARQKILRSPLPLALRGHPRLDEILNREVRRVCLTVVLLDPLGDMEISRRAAEEPIG